MARCSLRFDMRYTVNVRLGVPLKFPEICPFTETPAPTGWIRFQKSATNFVLPLPHVLVNSYSTTSFRIPASRQVARAALIQQLLSCLFYLGGISYFLLFLAGLGPEHSTVKPLPVLLGGLVLGTAFGIARFRTLRPVRISNAWEGFVEVSFSSREYATQFSELNRFAMIED